MSKLKKAEELVSLITKTLGKEDADIIVYSKESDSEYNELDYLASSREKGISHYSVAEDGSIESSCIFINLDEVLKDVNNENFNCLCFYLDVKQTITNRFIFVLLHQIGHWWQGSLLGQVGKAPLIQKVRIALDGAIPEDFKEGELGDILNPESLFSDFYATATIHRVIKDLESADPKYLTYLD